jgi:glycosyltransferase 2 family protein
VLLGVLPGVLSGYHGKLAEKKSRSIHKRALLVVINALSIASLVWALRDSHLSELRDDVATLSWWWVVAAVASDAGVYLWQSMRWRILLRPVERVGFWETVRAVYVGLFANEVLPFRAGEVLRCYLLSKRSQLPLSVSLTSALLERVFDGIWLCLCMFLVLRYVPIPRGLRYLVDGGYVLAIVVLGAALLLSFALFRRHHARAALSGGTWRRQFQVLIDDLEIIGHSRYLLLSFVQSLPYLLLQAIPIFAAFRAYGFDLPWGAAFALMVILRMGAVAPQAPGNLGLFQFLARECLEKMFNVVPDEAARFSLVLWGLVTLPLLAGGMIAMAVTGLKLGELQEAARSGTNELSRSRDELSRSRES